MLTVEQFLKEMIAGLALRGKISFNNPAGVVFKSLLEIMNTEEINFCSYPSPITPIQEYVSLKDAIKQCSEKGMIFIDDENKLFIINLNIDQINSIFKKLTPKEIDEIDTKIYQFLTIYKKMSDSIYDHPSIYVPTQ